MKIRVSYSKLGKIRFTGHRDVAHMWERTMRKAGIAVAMSVGFTPRPKMSFGLALPTGAESLIELIDITLDPNSGMTVDDLDSIADQLSASLPVGMRVTGIRECAGTEVSLQEGVVATTWLMLVAEPVDGPDIESAIERVNNSAEVLLMRERKGEKHLDNIRPGILELRSADAELMSSLPADWIGESVGHAVVAVLTTSGRGIRPTELVEVLVPESDPPINPWDHLNRVLRINQWIERDGERVDVLTDRPAHTSVSA